MRCRICDTFEYMYEHFLETCRRDLYYLCQKCYEKHPVHLMYSLIPNEFSLITMIHAIHDGHYPNYVYNHLDIHIMTWFMIRQHFFIFLFYDMDDMKLLHYLIQLDWPMIILSFEQDQKEAMI